VPQLVCQTDKIVALELPQQSQVARQLIHQGRSGSRCWEIFNHVKDDTSSARVGAALNQGASNCLRSRSNALRSCLPGFCEGRARAPAALRASAARERRSRLPSVSS